MSKKRFVIDTNVIVYDPQSIFTFEENDLIIPIVVIEELDKFKSEQNERGASAREFSRTIEKLRARGSLADGVSLGENLGTLTAFAKNIDFAFVGLPKSNDNLLLGITRHLGEDESVKTILVTKDTNLRLKADALGIPAEDYIGSKVEPKTTAGIPEIHVDGAVIDNLYMGERSQSPEFIKRGESVIIVGGDFDPMYMKHKKNALVRRVNDNLRLVRERTPAGMKPRNSEQKLLVDALLDPDVKMVVCAGVAGSGKTLLSMAAGVELVDKGKYDKVMITKAIQPVGNDIGFVKGDKQDKMAEWVKPFFDNLDLILKEKGSVAKRGPFLDEWIEDFIEVEAITYLRGRSLMNRFIIVDEVQNLSPKIIKTVVSRVADSSKLVLLGDLHQIDNPYLDIRNNGLSHVMNRMSDISSIAVFNLANSVRGELAKLAAELL